MLSRYLGKDLARSGAPLALPAFEPVGDAQEARPPERARFLVVRQWLEVLLANCLQFESHICGQSIRENLCEFTDRFVDEGAAVGGARRGVNGFEREQPQDMLGVDRVRIAQPVFDVRDAQLGRPGFRRGTGCGRATGDTLAG